MTQPHASTGRTYADKAQTPVPFPAYRCKATATDQRTATSSYTHQCKKEGDHDGKPHACVCGREWEPVAA